MLHIYSFISQDVALLFEFIRLNVCYYPIMWFFPIMPNSTPFVLSGYFLWALNLYSVISNTWFPLQPPISFTVILYILISRMNLKMAHRWMGVSISGFYQFIVQRSFCWVRLGFFSTSGYVLLLQEYQCIPHKEAASFLLGFSTKQLVPRELHVCCSLIEAVKTSSSFIPWCNTSK